MRSFDVRLIDGQWVRINALPEPETPALPVDLIAQLLITLIIVIAVVMIAVRQATKPLKQLAQAADTLGRDLDATPLAESGPAETRLAAQAFNRMQARIDRLIADRVQALAAVSHDLRTPIARLRLRAGFIEDQESQRKIDADLDEMEAMITATLAYLRGEAEQEQLRVTNLAAILETLCDDATDAGRNVSYDGPSQVRLACRPIAIKRALANLINNAVKYGGAARVTLRDHASSVEVAVEDDGPGIPESELEAVFTPFRRLESSRNRETGGTGLGLTIARNILRAHGGDVVLRNRPEGGLSAVASLPG